MAELVRSVGWIWLGRGAGYDPQPLFYRAPLLDGRAGFCSSTATPQVSVEKINISHMGHQIVPVMDTFFPPFSKR